MTAKLVRKFAYRFCECEVRGATRFTFVSDLLHLQNGNTDADPRSGVECNKSNQSAEQSSYQVEWRIVEKRLEARHDKYVCEAHGYEEERHDGRFGLCSVVRAPLIFVLLHRSIVRRTAATQMFD